MSVFDAIRVTDTLENAVSDTLQTWFPTYLKEFELQMGLIGSTLQDDPLPLPVAYTTATRLDREVSNRLPAIVVVSPGMSPRKRPQQEGDGSFRVWWGLGIGVFVAGNDRASTARLIRWYTAIVRMVLLQHQSLGGVADGCEWFDESYDDAFNFVDEQTVGAGQVTFEFEMAGVVNRYGGPGTPYQPPPAPDPINQPGSNWPLVLTHEETVKVEP